MSSYSSSNRDAKWWPGLTASNVSLLQCHGCSLCKSVHQRTKCTQSVHMPSHIHIHAHICSRAHTLSANTYTEVFMTHMIACTCPVYMYAAFASLFTYSWQGKYPCFQLSREFRLGSTSGSHGWGKGGVSHHCGKGGDPESRTDGIP